MRGLSILMCVLVACTSTDPGTEDADPGDPGSDVGLTIAFAVDVELPLRVEGVVEVRDVFLNGSVIRAVGDATTQDERPTTTHDHELRWERETAPPGVTFAAAPPGEYSYVELRIAGRGAGSLRSPQARSLRSKDKAFRVRGEARVDGEDKDFVIEAEEVVVAATVPASMRLEAGRPITIRVVLDVLRLVEQVHWEGLPEDDGVLYLDERRPVQLELFMGALAGAFRGP